jgi:hypothetical protein
MELPGLKAGIVAELKRSGGEMKVIKRMTVADLLVIQDAYLGDGIGQTILCQVMGIASATCNRYMVALQQR